MTLTTDQLLARMASVLQADLPTGPWHARAKGQSQYAHGATAREAMMRALGQPIITIDDEDDGEL